MLVDPSVALDGEEALARVTPEVKFPEAESRDIPEYYSSPFPLSEKYFYVSYSPKRLRWEGEPPQDADALGIYTLDILGTANWSSETRRSALFARRPFERETPTVWSSQRRKTRRTKVYVGRRRLQGLRDKVERGSIKEIRVVQLFPKTTRDADNPPIGKAREENGRAILGTLRSRKTAAPISASRRACRSTCKR